MRPALPHRPLITQPGRVRFDTWCLEQSYFIDCIFDNLQRGLVRGACGGDTADADAVFDWNAMYIRLRRYLYARSRSSFKSHACEC